MPVTSNPGPPVLASRADLDAGPVEGARQNTAMALTAPTRGLHCANPAFALLIGAALLKEPRLVVACDPQSQLWALSIGELRVGPSRA